MYFGQIFKSFELLQVNKLDSYAFYKLVRICQLMPEITATQKMQHCYFIVYYWKGCTRKNRYCSRFFLRETREPRD